VFLYRFQRQREVPLHTQMYERMSKSSTIVISSSFMEHGKNVLEREKEKEWVPWVFCKATIRSHGTHSLSLSLVQAFSKASIRSIHSLRALPHTLVPMGSEWHGGLSLVHLDYCGHIYHKSCNFCDMENLVWQEFPQKFSKISQIYTSIKI
jgi:hypothetical protein